MTSTPSPGTVAVLIPALNEEQSLGRVLADIPEPFRERIVVVDNGSVDRTVEVARAGGATVVSEPRRGYGAACLRGLKELAQDPPFAVVFLDADYSDHPSEMTEVAGPVIRGEAELVIGSRARGEAERGSLTSVQRFGNALATVLIRIFYGIRFTDLGPFRAVTWSALERLHMEDEDYGWTVEMQVKAAKRGIVATEVPVSYRKRIGKSKIAGTVRGVWGAGTKILWVIFREAVVR